MPPMAISSEATNVTKGAHIQVVVANLPPVTFQVVAHLILQEPDMDLRSLPRHHEVEGVHNIQLVEDLLLALDAWADVLVLGVASMAPLPGICSTLLSAFPYLKIVTMTPTAADATLYWLGLREQDLRLESGNTLVGAIRQAYHIDPTSKT
jgi:hypothetical protein